MSDHSAENEARLRARLRDVLVRHRDYWLELDGLHCGCGWVKETTSEHEHIDHVLDSVMVYVSRVTPPAAPPAVDHAATEETGT